MLAHIQVQPDTLTGARPLLHGTTAPSMHGCLRTQLRFSRAQGTASASQELTSIMDRPDVYERALLFRAARQLPALPLMDRAAMASDDV